MNDLDGTNRDLEATALLVNSVATTPGAPARFVLVDFLSCD